ncbi:hypothetical protein UFOVP679_54 [uncultured Caudovirales phage]|uniref:Uncharacterized protein n=1 Tax=uncultured Caudovirales phage TaxID=2100421 RepID=A0A6J5NGJ4_9CAUD|nr:hypothetical protein UFOVP679_54 [uncultured Caudovirales phage]
MSGFVPLWTSEAGVQKSLRVNGDGSIDVALTQDVGALLDRNKAMANHNDGYSASREMRRVGSIPWGVINQWLAEGFDPFDPDNKHILARKLNDSDFRDLRTAGGHLGVSNGVMR